ncbi:BT1 folate/biopterin transporter family protein [Theileria equi strain WA]|uniref:BT1 folate/biopterin transporter family protein n=1 Tax=Theileria equi strain WA TaxID=1537102 RepID=L1LCL6_THEEQ|nr:BT1 folate/biopterin transporter family protein [Theileria equi strain WA]EKX72903.1 BT1 folate/biopterin transporter family protein [Theileria equi strain WA]|eukprot:XP_004832355.1 BT1 folate/biopterin transporter family protein [Theileria equi strain WA]
MTTTVVDLDKDLDLASFKFDDDYKGAWFFPKSKRKLTLFLVYMIGFSEGLLHLASLALYYMFKDDLSLSPSQLSAVYIVPSIPYLTRPVLAYITDSKPIFGTRRKHYLILLSLLQSFSFLSLAIFPPTLWGALLSLFFIQFSLAFCITIAEALVVENISKGDDNLSSFIGSRALASLLVSYYSGSLLETYSKERIFVITSMFPLLITFFSLFLHEDKAVIVYTSHPAKELIIFLKNPVIMYPALYVFVLVCGPDYFESLFYYITNELGYTATFMGTLRLVYGIAALSGILAHKYLYGSSGTRKILLWSTLIALPFYMSPALLTSGMNKSLGIPDKVLILCGGFLLEAIGELQILPILTYTSKIAPKGLEASVFAALMTVKSLGLAVSKIFTALLVYFMGITATDFSNLTNFILICGILSYSAIFVLKYIPSDDEMEVFVTQQMMAQQITNNP